MEHGENEMTNEPAKIGHNSPPTPMEIVASEYASTIEEVSNWADGEAITTDEQEAAVDALIKEIRSYGTAVKKAADEHKKPLYDVYVEAQKAGKSYIDDAERMKSALVACVAPFKAKKLAEKQAAERAAWEAAQAAKREAEEAAAKVNAADLEAVRELEATRQAAIDAENAAKAASKDKPKGMRSKTTHEVVDMRALVNWIATHDKPAMAEFANAYAQRNGADIPNEVVKTVTEKVAY